MCDAHNNGCVDQCTVCPLEFCWPRGGVRDSQTNSVAPGCCCCAAQVLSTRARKEVALADVKVQVCVYAFDCLYYNGASLLHEPLTKRRDVLHSALVEKPGQLAHATTKISNDVEELEVGG